MHAFGGDHHHDHGAGAVLLVLVLVRAAAAAAGIQLLRRLRDPSTAVDAMVVHLRVDLLGAGILAAAATMAEVFGVHAAEQVGAVAIAAIMAGAAVRLLQADGAPIRGEGAAVASNAAPAGISAR